MTIDALLYLGVELTDDDLASLVRDWRGWRGARRVTIGGIRSDSSRLLPPGRRQEPGRARTYLI